MGDARKLSELLSEISADQEVASVAADGAHHTRKCHNAIVETCAHSVIPLRKNAKQWKAITSGAAARSWALRTSIYLRGALWRQRSGYNRQRCVGRKIHRVNLLDQRVMAREFDHQVAEFQIRATVLNSYTALGIPVR